MMQKMGSRVSAFFAALFVVLSAVAAQAAVTLPTSVNTADVETLAGIILTGLAIIWSIRKLIKMTNKS